MNEFSERVEQDISWQSKSFQFRHISSQKLEAISLHFVEPLLLQTADHFGTFRDKNRLFKSNEENPFRRISSHF